MDGLPAKSSSGIITGHDSYGAGSEWRLGNNDDLVLAVDGKTVRDVKELEQLLRPMKEKKPGEVVFFVRRGVQTLFVEVQPTWGEPKEASR